MEKEPVKAWDIVSIVVVIFLTLAFSPRIACSETLGGAIEGSRKPGLHTDRGQVLL